MIWDACGVEKIFITSCGYGLGPQEGEKRNWEQGFEVYPYPFFQTQKEGQVVLGVYRTAGFKTLGKSKECPLQLWDIEHFYFKGNSTAENLETVLFEQVQGYYQMGSFYFVGISSNNKEIIISHVIIDAGRWSVKSIADDFVTLPFKAAIKAIRSPWRYTDKEVPIEKQSECDLTAYIGREIGILAGIEPIDFGSVQNRQDYWNNY